MKKAFLLLLLIAAGCQKNDPATEEFEVQTQGRNPDCGVAQVLVKEPEKVAQAIGASSKQGATYLALQLDTALWLRQNRTLLLRLRRPTPEEGSILCHAQGPVYPALTVVSARVKP